MSKSTTPFCSINCPDPKHPEVCTGCVRRVAADRLQEASGNVLSVTYAKGVWLDNDEDSKDHLYYAYMAYEHDEDTQYLDDRGPEPLEVQLVAELRRVGQFYLDLATKVEANIAKEVCA